MQRARYRQLGPRPCLFWTLIHDRRLQSPRPCARRLSPGPGDTAQVGASDDGEPKGTAGRPMLTALLHSDVGEVAAVVTRYFGGILLGTGGLVRAYQGSVKLGLEGLPVTLRKDMRRFVVSIEPHQVSDFQHFLAEARGRVQSSDFRFDATFEVLVPSDEADAFVERLSEATAGAALIDPIDEE